MNDIQKPNKEIKRKDGNVDRESANISRIRKEEYKTADKNIFRLER